MQRIHYLELLTHYFQVNPIIALLGPRQCGKTTLAREYFANQGMLSQNHYFDLEDPEDLARLEDPKLALSPLEGLIVIDEIQRRPDLFPVLRVLIDQYRAKQRYLILGSASRDLIQQSSETLAGRISYCELTPFSYWETNSIESLWLRGGFPLAYLAGNDEISYQWRKDYIITFLERDIPNLGIQIAPHQLRRFWQMIAHYHGNIFNASELGASLSISDKTARHYLDILCSTFMLRQLQPWSANLKKRQVKSPKVYFRDSGILHALIGITDYNELLTHPKLGASWEGWALEEVIRYHQADPLDCYFWGVHSQAELDLLIVKNGKQLAFEFKYSSAPSLTRSMIMAVEDLKLDHLTVIYPGKKRFWMSEKIEAVGFSEYFQLKSPA